MEKENIVETVITFVNNWMSYKVTFKKQNAFVLSFPKFEPLKHLIY